MRSRPFRFSHPYEIKPADQSSGLVDFELWEPFSSEMEVGRTEELQKWGLAHKPPAKNWWAEFGIHTC